MRHWPSEALLWLKEKLTEYLITGVADDDPAKAGAVVLGQLQADPSRLKVAVSVHENDPDDEREWRHNLIELRAQEDNRRFRQVIGRPRAYWNRRFVVKTAIFLRGMTREEALAVKASVLTRIEQILLDHPQLDGLSDDRGEVAIEAHLVAEHTTESGDGQRQPIWRSKLWIQVQTLRPG